MGDGVVEHRTPGTYAHVHAASGAFDRFFDALSAGVPPSGAAPHRDACRFRR
jgi:hypothetical protein